MSDRLKCLCPGCRRTTPAGRFPEWICARHWSALPKDHRRAYRRALRRGKDPKALARLWRLLSRRAVEAALLDPLL